MIFALFAIVVILYLIGLKAALCIALFFFLLYFALCPPEWLFWFKTEKPDKNMRVGAMREYIYRKLDNRKDIHIGYTKDGHTAWYVTENESAEKAELMYTLRRSKATGKYYLYYKDTTEKEFAFMVIRHRLYMFPYNPKDEEKYV